MGHKMSPDRHQKKSKKSHRLHALTKYLHEKNIPENQVRVGPRCPVYI